MIVVKIKYFLNNFFKTNLTEKDIRLSEIKKQIVATKNYTELVTLIGEYNKLKTL
jgi:hypothetical protein